jgi:hypothetical protein
VRGLGRVEARMSWERMGWYDDRFMLYENVLFMILNWATLYSSHPPSACLHYHGPLREHLWVWIIVSTA